MIINYLTPLHLKSSFAITVQCCRHFAARRGKRIERAKLNEKLAKQRREQRKYEPPKVWIPPRLRVDRATLNIEPRRFCDDNRKDLSEILDDVYITKLYKEMKYGLPEALEMHRETHHITQMNEPNALVDATIELDLRLKKKNRYLEPFRGLLSYPNSFDQNTKDRKIIAICKKTKDQEAAKEAGANVVGSSEVIRMLQIGDITMAQFDDLVCHGDCLVELANIRGVLGDAFPSKQRGNVGFDMKKLVTQFVYGIEYQCKKDDYELDYGWVTSSFGRLDMEDELLEQNLTLLLETIDKYAPPDAPAPFITRVLITSEPSKEKFAIKFWNYAEGYPDPYAVEEEESENEDKQTNFNIEEISKL